MKKCIALILFATVLTSLCTSCAQTDPGEDVSTSAADSTESAEITSTSEAETEYVEPFEAEIKNYDGKTVNIVLAGNWEYYDFTAEETNGETVNDAKYAVNDQIGQLFNVDIAVHNHTAQPSEGTGAGYTLITTMNMAGTGDYDIAEIGCYDVSTLACENELLDLNSVPNIDLSKSWWDPKANEHLSIAGKMFYSTGDASTLDNDCTYCILFNKQMITDYNLENPYDLVREDRWTYDKFIEMADAVDNDLNSSGTTDAEDSIGIIMWQDSVIGMLHASGGRFASINESGVVEATFNTERNLDVVSSWITLKTTPIVGFLGTGGNAMPSADLHTMFQDGRALFYCRYLQAASWFREMETDFGILPYPKWDDTQTDFCNTVHAYGTSYLCVPTNVKDIEMSGAILESLAYYGQQILTPAYYDTTLKNRDLRDEDSAEMLDLIFVSRFFDVGAYYQVGNLNGSVISMMQNGNANIASIYKRSEKNMNNKISQINEAFAAILTKDQ